MPRLGYLLPTRERIMGEQPENRLAAGRWPSVPRRWDSIPYGSAIRSWPDRGTMALTLPDRGGRRAHAKVELGTAVLLPALRNPVLLGPPGSQRSTALPREG